MKPSKTANQTLTGKIGTTITAAVSALILSTLAISTLSLAVMPEPVPSTQPPPVDQILGAQINITRDSISHLMRTLQERRSNQSLAAPDYQAAQAVFVASADRVTQAFEQKLEQQVLSPITDLLARYNAVLNEQSFSDAQRTRILESLKTRLNALSTSLKANYKTLLKEVYAVAGNLPFDYRIRLSDTHNNPYYLLRNGWRRGGDLGWMRTRFYGIRDGMSVDADRLEYKLGPGTFFNEANHLFGVSEGNDNHIDFHYTNQFFIRGGSVQTLYPMDSFSYESSGASVLHSMDVNPSDYVYDIQTTRFRQSQWLGNIINERPQAFDSVFEELVFPAVSEGCASELCLNLKAADLTTFINLTYESLDRDLTFTAQDGFQVIVRSPKLDHEHVIALLIRSSNPDHLPYTVQ